MKNDRTGLIAALNDFRQARRKAKLQSLIGIISGKRQELLSYDEVKKHVNISNPRRHYHEEIPIDSIVGSVGRYMDFNKRFFPLTDSDAERWARVKLAQEEKGLPPIEVYKIGYLLAARRTPGSPEIENYHLTLQRREGKYPPAQFRSSKVRGIAPVLCVLRGAGRAAGFG